MLAESPETQLLAGGTDFMVEVNFGHRDPRQVVSLRGVAELQGWSRDGDVVTLRAGLTYTEMQQAPLADLLPVLAQAARTVGSPQIRNAGTLGGNLGTSSPAGDALPPLLALDATVVLASRAGTRRVPLAEFVTGPKQNVRRPDEVILAAEVAPARGPQEFVKVGTRNAMVISVASVALVVDADARSVRCALGFGRPGGVARDPRPSNGLPHASTGTRSASPTLLTAPRSRRWSRPRPDRSTTTVRPPPTGAARSKSVPAAPSSARYDGHGHVSAQRQRHRSRSRRGVDRREPALRLARAARAARREERVRARRVRLVLGARATASCCALVSCSRRR